MRRLDRFLVVLGSLAFVAALSWAAVEADTVDTSGWTVATVVPAREPADAATLGANLPEGVTLDPQTLELVGLDVVPEDGSVYAGWDVLRSYEYQERLVGLPDALKELDGKKVTMAGFLLPIYEFRNIREFHLVASHWSCCFGVPPGLNGWVHVKLAPGQRGLDNTVEPLLVTGTFRVAEHEEAGYVVAIYALERATARVVGW